jgi:predicted ATPase
MLRTVAVANYRSLRNLALPLDRLNVITGPNGSGKSSLYRSLRLLADTAQSRVVPSLAREGGLQSTLWAGPETISRSMRQGHHPVQGTRRKEPVNLRLGFSGEQFGYLIDLGLPIPGSSAFGFDPEIKQEYIWHGSSLRPSTKLVERIRPVVRVRAADGSWAVVAENVAKFESMMTQIADPRNAPEVHALRESIRAWRFYDHFRTDADAPARMPQVGTYTPVLGHDGADLAAAIQTIFEMGDHQGLSAAVDDAFPGSKLQAVSNDDGRFFVTMRQHGLLRSLSGAELSDGTLRYLLWIAALLTPRPPELMVLNEPETSLHPDLLPALGRLICSSAKRSQLVVVTHSQKLISSLAETSDCNCIRLEKSFGETKAILPEGVTVPKWDWPSR